MSLTQPFGNCEKNNVAHIKTITPSKSDFYSDNGTLCFNKKRNVLVPYQFSEPFKATLSGIAFDYIARFLVAEKAKQYRDLALTGLVAEHIYLYSSSKWFHHEDAKNQGHNQYKSYLRRLSDLIDNDALMNSDEAIRICVVLAKMERESRAGKEIAPTFEITVDDEDVVQDVISLAQVFSASFLPRVTSDSVIVFNPTFGIGSRVVGGADADLFIDGTLYDFKVKKENSWSGVLARQLVGYYIIDSIAKDAEDSVNKLSSHPIERVALYNARFAETDYYDVDRLDPVQLELTKSAIRHEYLMRRLRNYGYDILLKLGIPLTEEELRFCSDDLEIEVEIWERIDKEKSDRIINAWNKLNVFLSCTDTNTLLRNIVALNNAKLTLHRNRMNA